VKPLRQCLTCRAWFFDASKLTRHVNLVHGGYAAPAANENASRKRKFAETGTAAAVSAAAAPAPPRPSASAAAPTAATALLLEFECDLCENSKAAFRSAPALAAHRKDCWNKLIRVTRALRTPLQRVVIEREQRARAGRAKAKGSAAGSQRHG